MKWLLAVTAAFEAWAGVFLMADRRTDIVTGFAGVVLTITAFLLLLSLLADATALLALVQVFTVTYQLILFILIATSLYMGMRDTFLIGLYFSSLFFFILQFILMKEMVSIVLKQHRRHYEDIEQGSTF